jgi:hypothetical protein
MKKQIFSIFMIFTVSLSCLLIVSGCKRERITEKNCGKAITKNAIIKDKGDGVDYVFDCQIIVTDGKLTIEEGVHIQFEGENSGIYVSDEGELDIIGSSNKRVILEGKVPQNGTWLGVIISSDKDNEIKYTDILHAGASQHQWMNEKAAVGLSFKREKPKVSLDHCTISKSGGHGLYVSHATGNLSKFDDNIMEDNLGYPVVIPFTEIGELDQQSRYNNPNRPNLEAAIGVYGEDRNGNRADLGTSTTLRTLDIPIRVLNPIFVNTSLVIKEGVRFHFTPNSFMSVYGADSSSYIDASGTFANPIYFTRASAEAGSGWDGVYFANNSYRNHLNNCVIEYGGKQSPFQTIGRGNVIVGGDNVQGRVKVESCTVRYSYGYGIDKRSDAYFSAAANTFQDNANGDIGTF